MALEERFTAPKDWQWDNFNNADGKPLRYGFCHAANPKGMIIFATGRTETAEEYFETARDFLKRDFSVAVLDWQGQGLSYRFGDDNTRQHSNGFHNDIDDFDRWLSVLNDKHDFNNLRKVLIAHSMGGNITLRYMADHPDTFDCAVMVAPMLGIKMNAVLSTIAAPVLHFARKKGWLNRHAPTQGAWSEKIFDMTKAMLSTDPVRRELQKYWYLKTPELQCGGVTYGWLAEAFISMRTLKDKNVAGKITTPTLFLLGGSDRVVSNDDTRKVIAMMPQADVITYRGAQHNMLKERDDIRNAMFKDMDAFIDKYLHPRARP